MVRYTPTNGVGNYRKDLCSRYLETSLLEDYTGEDVFRL